MRLYIDSAEISSLGPLLKTGVFHGVTTNPLILKQAGIPMKQIPRLADRVFAHAGGRREAVRGEGPLHHRLPGGGRAVLPGAPHPGGRRYV